MKRFFVTCVLACVAFSTHAQDDASFWQMLQKASAAAHALSYQGIFICQANKQQAKSVQIKHLYNGQQEFTRNIVLDGAPREMFSQGGDLVIYNPKNEQIVIEKRQSRHLFPDVLPADIESLKPYYALNAGNTERVAGREVQILLLAPKDQYRNRHQFWIDSEYGLILKAVTLNSRNEPIDNVAFSQINLFDTVDLDWFKPKIDTNKHYVMEENSPIVDNSPSPHWQLGELPAGFRKVNQMLINMQSKNIPVTHVVFSDGLASVSLFIEPLPNGAKMRNGASMMGNTSVYTRSAGFLKVTAVGEVPEATTAHIAKAVMFIK